MRSRSKSKGLMMGMAALATAGASLWATSDARAGAKYNTVVSVWSPSSTKRAAQGALGAARNSSDANQAIGCQVYSIDGGAVRGSCYAYDASNQCAGCSTSDPDLLEVIKSMWTSSFIQFYAASDGTCETIRTYNDSFEPPQLP